MLVVAEAIEGGRGKVRVGDTLWPVEGPDLPVGAHVTVTGTRGTALLVQRVLASECAHGDDERTQITREERPTKGRYVATVEGIEGEAELTYSRTSPTLIIADHTEVPDVFRGQGMGRRLATRMVEDARREGVKIFVLCPFVNAERKSIPTGPTCSRTEPWPVAVLPQSAASEIGCGAVRARARAACEGPGMPPFRLMAALLTAASGVTGAAFAVDAYLAPRMMPGPPAPMTAGVSTTHQKIEALPRALAARTRFVAVEDTPRPAKPKPLPERHPQFAKAPAKKTQLVKDNQPPKPKKAQQAAVQWPWSLFGN